MPGNVYIYILIMAAVSFAIRFVPLALVSGKLENRFLQSFLYYVPYVTLAVMTFPAIIQATNEPVAGALALAAGMAAAWKGCRLFAVAAVCCITVLITEFVIYL
jgi:branched-subunit amino acid transport protein